MANIKDLQNNINNLINDDSMLLEFGDKIGALMIQESKNSLSLPKSGVLNRRTMLPRSSPGEPPANDYGTTKQSTSHFVKASYSGSRGKVAMLTLQNETEYAHRLEVGYDRPYLSYGRDKILEQQALIQGIVSGLFQKYFSKHLG